MLPVDVCRSLDADRRRAIVELLDLTAATEGERPLSDHSWHQLHADSPEALTTAVVWDGEDAVAYGQISPTHTAQSIELVIHPARRTDEVALSTALLDALIASAGNGAALDWIVADPQAHHGHIARRYGFTVARTLLQMRRQLPLPATVVAAPTLPTRPFRPGPDDAAWLSVNNRAFGWHPEQGGWTVDTLRARIAEPWFDPDGFLVHERDGVMAGFCWTKLHTDQEPVLGEIYVIAVDPEFHGLGLGRALTIAGLEWIASRGVTVGMLYVDGDNTAAVTLYRSLGFEVHRTDRIHHLTVGEQSTHAETT